MTAAALVRISDQTVVLVTDTGVGRLELPTEPPSQVSPVVIGWSDGDLAILELVPFTPPPGYRVTGGVTRTVVDDQVIEDAETEVIPPVVPEEISDRQFAQGLWKRNIISFEEAMAFLQTGTIPAALQALIGAIPDETMRKEAQLLIAGATIFKRHQTFTVVLGAAYGWDDATMDGFWIECAGYN